MSHTNQHWIVRSFFVCIVSVFLIAASSLSAQARVPASRIRTTEGPEAVVGGQWDFFISGKTLFYRSGDAKTTERMQSIDLPTDGKKIAADTRNVYVWLADGSLASYAIGAQGPASYATFVPPNDPTANAALSHPLIIAARRGAKAVRTPDAGTISPQRLLVANSQSDTISVVDTSSNSVIGTVNLVNGANPQDVVVSSNNYQAFSANFGNKCGTTACQNFGVTIFDPVALTQNPGALSANSPIALTLTPDTNTLFVGDDLLVRGFSTVTGAQSSSASLPASAQAIAMSNDGTTAYVAISDDAFYPTYPPINGVSVLNVAAPTSVTSVQFPNGGGCDTLAVNPVSGVLYVDCNFALAKSTPTIYAVSISNGNTTVLNQFTISSISYSLAFSPDGSKIYIPQYSANNLLVMDANSGTPLATIATGTGPAEVSVNSSGTRAYVSNYQSNNVTVIDLTSNTVITTIAVGQGPIGLGLTYTAPGAAVGSVGATVNGASFAQATPVAAGSLVSIFGTNIGPATPAGAVNLPLPTSLGGYSVTINGKAAPLLYVSSGQINCQMPFEVAGLTSVPVVVTNGTSSSAASNVNVASSAPGIFTVGGTTQGVILDANNNLISATNPAKPGQVVVMYATGQGAVTNAPASGAAALSSPLSITPTNPIVLIGNQTGTVQFSGLTAGLVGLWQINVTIPSNATPGAAVPVQIVQNGLISNTVNITISN